MNSWIYFYFAMLAFCVLSYTTRLAGTYPQQFWFLTGLLAAYNGFELFHSYRRESRHFWIRPVVLGAMVMFFLQHGGITNFLYRDEMGGFYQTYNNALIKEPVWLVRTMSLVLAASVCYWLGYKTILGTQFGIFYKRAWGQFWNFKISNYNLLIGLVFGWVIKLILNHYGAIGHRFGAVIKEAGEIPASIYRYKIFENVSLLFTVVFMYLAIQHRTNRFYWVVFAMGLLFEIVFGMTSGARSTLIFVFFGVFLVDYYHRGYLRWMWVVGGVVVLVFAMTVLKDFKEFAMKSPGEAATTDPLAYIKSANAYRDQVARGVKSDEAMKRAMFLSAVGRFNYVNEATQVMRYKEMEGLKESDPDFVTPFLTFPLFAIVPQFWVLGKPVESYGSWATHLLINSRRFSIAFSPVGFSYLAGGPLFVLFNFFLLGILMKWLEYLFKNLKTVIGFILFLALLKLLVMFDTNVWSTYLNLIRYGILFPPLMWFLLRKWPKATSA